MDNARWIVVLSVIICMMVTLTLLKRYAGNPQLVTQTTVSEEKKVTAARPVTTRAVVPSSGRREIPRFGKISFPKPAPHTLAVEQAADLRKIGEANNKEGVLIR